MAQEWGLATVAVFASFAIGISLWSSWLQSAPGIITEPDEIYDFIIVGAGTAGSVLASRLSEVSSARVLVVEAGDTEPWLSTVPFFSPLLQLTGADWAYVTSSQQHAAYGLKNNQSRWPRGKVLGGSSTINYLLHMRGHESDFNQWASDGCDGWNFDKVLPYFMKSENYHSENRAAKSNFRGNQGSLHVTEAECSALCKAWLEAAVHLGLNVTDINDGYKIGFMRSQLNIYNGKRVSGSTAYLWPPVYERNNLHVLLNSHVTKVKYRNWGSSVVFLCFGKNLMEVIMGNDACFRVKRNQIIFENRTAVGIEYRTPANQSRSVRVRKEVLLCSGAIGSAQLLLLSGVGSESHLKAKGIPVIANLVNVGRNLKDHLNYPLYIHLNKPVSWNMDKIKKFSTVWDYFVNIKGLLSQTGVEVVGTHRFSSKLRPELLFILFNMGSIDADMYTTLTNIKREIFQEIFPDTGNYSKEGFVVLISCLHPQSKGSVKLSSSDPFLPPIINPNYLSREDDVKCLSQGIGLIERFVEQPSLRELGTRIHLPLIPECIRNSPAALNNSAYLECLIRNAAITVYHPVGTCRMGPSKLETSVVNPQLKVLGVNHLRVVDASIFPSHVSGTPNAVVTMIAQMAADFIRSEWYSN